MKKTIRLTEGRLRNIIKESVKKYLKEASYLQRDIDNAYATITQDEHPDYYGDEAGDKNYVVYLWPGSGYRLYPFVVYGVGCEDDAITVAVRYCADNAKEFIITDEEIDYFMEEDDPNEEEFGGNTLEYGEYYGWMYCDPGLWVRTENLKVEEI